MIQHQSVQMNNGFGDYLTIEEHRQGETYYALEDIIDTVGADIAGKDLIGWSNRTVKNNNLVSGRIAFDTKNNCFMIWHGRKWLPMTINRSS